MIYLIAIILFLLLVSAVALVEAALLWLLWDLVVYQMFDGPEMTYWTAFVVCIVINILSGKFRVEINR